MSDLADDAAAIRDLAERALGSPFLQSQSARDYRARLLPKVLPGHLPVDLPALPQGRLIGSVIRAMPALGHRPPAHGDMITVIYETPESAAAVLDFYEREIPARGWTLHEPGGPPDFGGFDSAVVLAPRRVFCASSRGPALEITVYEIATDRNEVRLAFDPNNPGLCTTDLHGRALRGQNNPLPTLRGPVGTFVQRQGASGGGGRWSASASLETTLSPSELEAHFAQQLAAAGWTRQEGGIDGLLAWSRWSRLDKDDWTGLLYVLREPVASRYFLRFHAEVTDDSGDNSGSWSGVTITSHRST